MDITFNCPKCGQNIVIDEAGVGLSVACPKCGYSLTVPNQPTTTKVVTPPPLPTSAQRVNASPSDSPMASAIAAYRRWSQQKENRVGIGVATGIAAYLLFRYYLAVGVFLVVMWVPCALGVLLGKKMLRSHTSVRAVFAWGGLLVWFLPPLGMFVSAAVWAGQDAAKPLLRERSLAIICFVLALVNGASGALMRTGQLASWR